MAEGNKTQPKISATHRTNAIAFAYTAPSDFSRKCILITVEDLLSLALLGFN
ncbi:hypothetical protein H6F60_11675 [Coleofasciculus sp. FACHB-129]|nr:hypothetical protein [Coleofasciculus sp. FACHB-129]